MSDTKLHFQEWYKKWNWTEEDMKEVTIDPDDIDEM